MSLRYTKYRKNKLAIYGDRDKHEKALSKYREQRQFLAERRYMLKGGPQPLPGIAPGLDNAGKAGVAAISH